MSTKKLVLILLTVLFCFRHPTTNAEQLPLRIAYPTFTPFHWIDESGEMKGIFYIIWEDTRKFISLDPVKRIFRNLPINVDANFCLVLLKVLLKKKKAYTSDNMYLFKVKHALHR